MFCKVNNLTSKILPTKWALKLILVWHKKDSNKHYLKKFKEIIRKLYSAHNHKHLALLFLLDIFYADRLGIAHISYPNFLLWCIFLIDQNQIHRLEALPHKHWIHIVFLLTLYGKNHLSLSSSFSGLSHMCIVPLIIKEPTMMATSPPTMNIKKRPMLLIPAISFSKLSL